jgi:cytochrome c oxidase cbb3-type subunit 3
VSLFHHRRVFAVGSTGTLACVLLAAHFVAMFAGCSNSPGRPSADSAKLAPNDVTDFAQLYAENCAGCHGANGRGGAAIALANPVYLGIVDDARIHNVISSGIPKTAMPAFAPSAGGLLTDKQIDVLAGGIRKNWAKPGVLEGANPPSYAAKSPGDAAHGALAFKTYCESCHGTGGRGAKASSITDDSFLALISDQGLRTVVITGRPELGAPDWRNDAPGRAMSDQDVTDIVAWLVAQRAQNPGQPYAAANSAAR